MNFVMFSVMESPFCIPLLQFKFCGLGAYGVSTEVLWNPGELQLSGGGIRIFRTSLKEASARDPFLFLLLLCLLMQPGHSTMPF